MTHPTEPHEHAAAGLDEDIWLPDDEVKRALYGNDDDFTLIEWLLIVVALCLFYGTGLAVLIGIIGAVL